MIRAVLTIALLLSAASVSHASAAGWPHWSKVDFTEQTHQGILRVQLEAAVVDGRRILSKLNIWMNGRPLRVPLPARIEIEDPQLHNVEAIYTASITCLDDECPRASDYPVWLKINFGKKIHRDEDDPKGTPDCEDSTLVLDVFEREVGTIQETICGETSEDTVTLYEPPATPNPKQ
jgi:hypothetical protein